MNKITRKRSVLVGALLLLALAWGGALHAAWLENVPVTVVQPNGDTLHLFATGDEFFNYLHDANGYTIMRHPQNGYYVYAEKQNGKLVATNIIVGSMNPATNGLQPHALISSEEWMQRRKVWEVADQRPQNRDVEPNHGTLNNISIFIRFSDDEEFVNSYSSIDNMFNDETENAVSMINYFRSASYNAITIHTHFYPGHNGETIISYQDSFPRSYYQVYNEVTNPNGYQTEEQSREREFALLERAVNHVNNNSPVPTPLNVDYDNDGCVDNVCFIVRGNVEGWNSLLWPHKWALYDRTVRINGKRVYTFNFQLADATNHFNTSTMCHEMNHTLGAPDLYHYSYSGPSPVGPWDLMENNAMPPQHCGAYMKMKYGHWIDEIPEITQVGTYTLNPISSPSPENVAYKIATNDPNQFYVLEYRNTATPFESALPGSGLLIYRIDTRFGGNDDYDLSSGIYDEVYIFRPDGTFSEEGNLESACFSANSGRTEFSQLTNPYPFFSEGTLDPKFCIYDISETGNTISFSYTNLYNIEVSAFPEQAGSVSGGGLLTEGSVCTVTATPNPGFAFMGWYNNALGSILYSRQPEYTFTVTHDRNLVAKFVPGNYTVTTSCSPNNGGTVSGNQGTYTAGSTVTLTATANSGYVFSCWTEDGQVLSNQPTYSFQIRSDRHLVANFVNLSFSLGTVITNPDGSKGVVFYINPTYTGGCMVALEDASSSCKWGNTVDIPFLRNYVFTKNECLLSDLDGFANTEVLREYQSGNTDYVSNVVDFEHGWYVPSAGQLRKIFSALPFIESAITNAGGATLTNNTYYWSSTEHAEYNAWTSAFEMRSKSKTANFKVRAVRDFSINNTLQVQVSTNNAELGNVGGAGFYTDGSQVTVTATPISDNLFRGWTEAGHLVSQDPSYTFSAYSNRDLVANFANRGGVGTLVTNPDGSQGILFHLNEDGSEGWMVALEDASEGCQWGPSSDIRIIQDRSINHQRVLEDQSGYHNTQLIRLVQGINNNYAASIVDFENGWYLPSAGQLRKLYATLPIIEEAITKAGGSLLTGGKYWSSTEYSATYASTPGFVISCTYKTSNCRVRAIRNYYPAGDNVVLVASNNENYGSVSGSGTFAMNQTVTVTATPNVGYQFDHWTENGAIVSYDAVYQFPFSRSRSLVAHFVIPGSIGSVVLNPDGTRGVVFYTDPSGTGSLIVALEDVSTGCAWGSSQDVTTLENLNPSQVQCLLEDQNGYANTQILRDWQQNNANYAAGKVDFANDWYLPSAGQLRKLYAALPLIEEAIVSAGGSLMTQNSYWSSSENSSSYAWSPSFAFTKTSKTSNLRVRAIRNTLQLVIIEVTANPSEGGNVTGAGFYNQGQTCTLTAIPNEGYSFVNWTENGVPVSTSSNYSFTVTGNRNLVANFMAIPVNYIINVSTNPSNGGTVTGGGSYQQGTTCTVTATANEGYSFFSWMENGEEVSASASYSFTVTSGRNLVAFFIATPVDCIINASASPSNGGSVIGAGTYALGQTCTLSASANPGYTFIGWTEGMSLEAGGVIISSEPNYSFTVTGNWNVVANFNSNPFHWNVDIYEYPFNMSVTGIIQIFGEEQNTPALEIGAFCGDVCRGTQRLTYFSQVNRYLVFFSLYGDAGDVMSFRLYDHTLGEELDLSCSATISFVPDGSIGNAFNPYIFDFGDMIVEQTSSFSHGYNWWSTYIEQNGIDGLSLLENSLGTNGLVIKSQSDGYTEYYEDYNLWYGSLESINNESSYMVMTSVPCTVTLSGTTALSSQHPITVDADGWTWIGYPVTYDMDINTALEGLASLEGDVLKSQEGYAEFYEGYGWFGSLATFLSSKGYMYKSTNTSPTTFTYPDNGRAATHNNITSKDNHWMPTVSAYPFNMTVTAVVELDGEELRSDRYELAAFANGESRGSVRLLYVEPIDRYVAFLTIAGEESADLSFALYDTETGVEYFPAEESLVFEANATIGRLGEPFVVSFRGTTGMDELANSLRVYPNPTNAGERFSIGLNTESKAPVLVEIVNALGVVVSVETSIQAPASIVAPVTAGVYTLRVTVEGKGTAVRKLVVK